LRRVLGLIVAALVVLAGAVALGTWMLARLGPETLRTRAEARLAALLGTDVQLGPVALRLGRSGLVASAAGFEAWPGPVGPMLSAERLELQLDPWSLVVGEVDPGWVAVHGALLRLRRDGDALRLALPPGAAPAPGGGEGPGLSFERALGRLLERVPQVDLTSARVVVAAGPGDLPPVTLESLDGSLARRWLRGGLALTLAGALRARGDAAGRFELSASADGGWQARVRVDELSLAALASLAPAAARGRIPSGRASGTLELEAPEGGAAALRFAVDAPRLRPPFQGAAPLEGVRLAGTLRGAPAPGGATRWLVHARARAGETAVPLEVEAVRSPEGALRIEQVSFAAPLELARLAPLVEALPEPARARVRELLPHVRAGRLLGAELAFGPAGGARALRARGRVEALVVEAGPGRLDEGAGEIAVENGVLRVAGAGARLGGEPAALAALLPDSVRERARAALARVEAARLTGVELRWPLGAQAPLAQASLRARVEDAALRVGARSRLEALSAEIAYEGGTLTLSGVEGRLDGRALPLLEARVGGADALAELRCVAPEPVPGLPGRRPLVEWVRGPPDRPAGPASWQRVRVEAEWLAHPALGCVVDDLAGTLEPVDGGGVRLAVERAVWAGHAVRGTLEHRAGPPESVRLEARIGAPRAPRRAEAPLGAWSRGRFHLASQRLGKWDAKSARGGFRLEGVQLALDDVALALDPGPVIEAEIALDLTRSDAVRFHADAQISRGEFGDLLRAMTDTTEPSVTGGFVGAISLRGALRPGHPTIGAADGGFSLHLRDGLIRRRFPLLLAVAMASETLNPFREQGTIRFGAMDAVGTLADGTWVVDTLQIDGPALRVLAQGRVGAVAPNAVEGVMGLFFFRTLDRAIGLVPLVSGWLLGGDRNLLGAYVALSGPWSGVSAHILPVKSLATGPASVVLEGVPTALQGGVRAIERMLQAVSSPPPGADGGAAPRADSRAPARGAGS